MELTEQNTVHINMVMTADMIYMFLVLRVHLIRYSNNYVLGYYSILLNYSRAINKAFYDKVLELFSVP